MKVKSLLFINLLFLFIFSLSVNAGYLVSNEAQGVRYNGTLVNGNVKIDIYDNMTGGSIVYSQTFTGAVVDGSWSVTLGEDSELNLTMNNNYFIDYTINGIDIDWYLNNGSTTERVEWTAPVGDIDIDQLNELGFNSTTEILNSVTNTLLDYYTETEVDSIINNLNNSLQSYTDTEISSLNSSLISLISSELLIYYNQTEVDSIITNLNSSLISYVDDGYINLTINNSVSLNGTTIDDWSDTWKPEANVEEDITNGNLDFQDNTIYNINYVNVTVLNIGDFCMWQNGTEMVISSNCP